MVVKHAPTCTRIVTLDHAASSGHALQSNVLSVGLQVGLEVWVGVDFFFFKKYWSVGSVNFLSNQ